MEFETGVSNSGMFFGLLLVVVEAGLGKDKHFRETISIWREECIQKKEILYYNPYPLPKIISDINNQNLGDIHL